MIQVNHVTDDDWFLQCKTGVQVSLYSGAKTQDTI